MGGVVGQSSSGGGLGIILIVWLAVVVFLIASMWRVFTKAGQPGWAAIVPIYNFIVLLKVARRPVWWILLYFVPFVNIVVLFLVSVDVAKNFGKSAGFGIGLALLSVVFYPILAWGSATYVPAVPPAPAPAAGFPPPPPPVGFTG
jgi:hypothetical protein